MTSFGGLIPKKVREILKQFSSLSDFFWRCSRATVDLNITLPPVTLLEVSLAMVDLNVPSTQLIMKEVLANTAKDLRAAGVAKS